MRLRLLLFSLGLSGLLPQLATAQTPAPKKLFLDLQLGGQYAYAEGGHFSSNTRPFTRHYFILKFWPGALLRYQATPRLAISTGYTGGATGWGYRLKMPKELTNNGNGEGGSRNGTTTAVYVDRIPLLLDWQLKSFNFKLVDANTGLYNYAIKLNLTGGVGAVRVRDFTNNRLSLGPYFGNDTIDIKEADPYIVNRWGAYVTAGATARFYRLGKEKFNIGLFLNQGFTDLVRVNVDYAYNGGNKGSHLFRSRGSGIGLTVGVPICLKTFRSAAPPARD